MEVSGKNASAFRNMAVWEGGYNVCIDVCRTADQCSESNNVLVQQLKSVATQIPLNLSKSASYKLGKQYVRHLRGAFVSSKQLETLLLICHDLNYIHTEKFLDLNSKLNMFSTKLWKYIKYSERKLKSRMANK
ncbi:four helix bundle protein [Candidatus Woesearchaeota archaeon]|nr:four helix bundle protein [Candidatus Woesearchaeota archaeon]